MARKLSDADVARLRELAGEGVPPAELAGRFGVTRRHVGRILRGEQRQQLGGLDRDTAQESVAKAVERFVGGLELDAAGEVRAESARVLAAKLDSARRSDTATAAHAAPGLARALLDTVASLRERHREPDRLDDLRMRREARLLAMRETNGAA